MCRTVLVDAVNDKCANCRRKWHWTIITPQCLQNSRNHAQ